MGFVNNYMLSVSLSSSELSEVSGVVDLLYQVADADYHGGRGGSGRVPQRHPSSCRKSHARAAPGPRLLVRLRAGRGGLLAIRRSRKAVAAAHASSAWVLAA